MIKSAAIPPAAVGRLAYPSGGGYVVGMDKSELRRRMKQALAAIPGDDLERRSLELRGREECLDAWVSRPQVAAA